MLKNVIFSLHFLAARLPQFVEPCLYVRFIRYQKPVLPCIDMHRLGGAKLQTGSLSMSSSVPNISNQTPHSVISYITENTCLIHLWMVLFVVPTAMPYSWSSFTFKFEARCQSLHFHLFPPSQPVMYCSKMRDEERNSVLDNYTKAGRHCCGHGKD